MVYRWMNGINIRWFVYGFDCSDGGVCNTAPPTLPPLSRAPSRMEADLFVCLSVRGCSEPHRQKYHKSLYDYCNDTPKE